MLCLFIYLTLLVHAVMFSAWTEKRIVQFPIPANLRDIGSKCVVIHYAAMKDEALFSKHDGLVIRTRDCVLRVRRLIPFLSRHEVELAGDQWGGVLKSFWNWSVSDFELNSNEVNRSRYFPVILKLNVPVKLYIRANYYFGWPNIEEGKSYTRSLAKYEGIMRRFCRTLGGVSGLLNFGELSAHLVKLSLHHSKLSSVNTYANYCNHRENDLAAKIENFKPMKFATDRRGCIWVVIGIMCFCIGEWGIFWRQWDSWSPRVQRIRL